MTSRFKYKGKTVLEGWPATLLAILVMCAIITAFTIGLTLLLKLTVFVVNL